MPKSVGFIDFESICVCLIVSVIDDLVFNFDFQEQFSQLIGSLSDYKVKKDVIFTQQE